MKDITQVFKPYLKPSTHRLEKKIYSLLKKKKSAEEVFNQIKKHKDIEELSRFLFNAGLDKTLLKVSLSRLKKGKEVAWSYLLKTFIKYKIYPNKDLAKIVFHSYLKANSSSELFACEEWGDISPEFQQMRIVFLENLEKKAGSKERDLLEKLSFVQVKDLISEEEEIILKLLQIDPSNQNYKQLKDDLEEKKAYLVIKNQKSHRYRKETVEEKLLKLSASSVFLKNDWLRVIFDTAKENPKQTKNLSLFLYFSGFTSEALELLDSYVHNISDYWFYLDWAMETKQYTKALALVNYLFSEYKSHEFSFISLIYTKSQILYKLGKKKTAVEYLKAVAQAQPDYKSASYFLDKWLKNE